MRSAIGGGARLVVDPAQVDRLKPQIISAMTTETVKDFIRGFNEGSPRYKLSDATDVTPPAPAEGEQPSSSVGTFADFWSAFEPFLNR
ncbi:MAG: hypothetical protein HOL04_11810 [Gammaproteobacteria bacterium]|jgi:hypothetical protein|nr:hypothetical protein [Gammaproteobacteria bacterium]MBT4607612.1 hypothetical protein [Thiotrichales bacterium]MBT3472384.1 hypothetical protein [Gammaproteobacteria bacterium]MBT3968617.1 hypothetical protein [Gammaproteobacteria bacterium]MBT4079023.1 hypothetical protein [Gammaproteobacteria bacterium]